VVHRPQVWGAVKAAPWLAYIFFVQNLFHLALPPAIVPTWALAVEEQYYFRLGAAGTLVAPAVDAGERSDCGLVCSPLGATRTPCGLGIANHTPDQTGRHRTGSLLALGLYTIRFSRRVWFGSAWEPRGWELPPRPPLPAGTAFSDSRLVGALPARRWP